ncbi:MAG: type I-E CRISPR-associated protein Cse1/CasA [Candidatus Competibacteraceae bacterium]
MNLLIEPLFRVRTPAGLKSLSLPGLLAALGEDAVDSLLGLQRHQEDAVHIFLCYLAGAVLARGGITDPIQPEAFWRDGLRQLAGRDDDCAWTLVVEDVTQPAFMQAPLLSKQELNEFKAICNSPDALDRLKTARNHDIKASRAAYGDPDLWIYALISLQTMSGYSGGAGGYNGIARMNSGDGSRPCVSLHSSERLGLIFNREVARLLQIRQGLLNGHWRYDEKGLVLTWLPIIDRQSAIEISKLDPFFIEVCRAVRLTRQSANLCARIATSKPRVIPKPVREQIKGSLGDPWIPINKKSGGALTIPKGGFSSRKIHEILFENKAAEMQKAEPEQEKQNCWLYAAVTVGGRCKTEGFYSINLPIPARVRPRLLRRGPELDRLENLSKTGLNDAAEMWSDVIRSALFTLLEANEKNREAKEWINRTEQVFSYAWNQEFFAWLWSTVDIADTDAARLPWLQTLERHARATLADAIARFPARTGRYYRSRVRANREFNYCLFKTFPELKEIAHAERRRVANAG